MRPWLSVIMPTYNGERYLDAALASVRREPLEGVEIVVVDDGSTDGTSDILRAYERVLPLTTIARAHVGNWTQTSNVGLREATGTHACFLHQDDLWLPGRIAAIRRELHVAPLALVLHHALFVGPDGAPLGPWRCPLRAGEVDSRAVVERLLVQNFVAMPTPVFGRELALDSGGLDESLWYTADWDLWLRLAANAPCRFIDAILAAFRIHPESQTLARRESSDDMSAQMTAVLDRHVAPGTPRGVQRAAQFSVRVNAALASAARGTRPPWGLLSRFIALGPTGWVRYLRDSRIFERVASRLRMRRAIAAIHFRDSSRPRQAP